MPMGLVVAYISAGNVLHSAYVLGCGPASQTLRLIIFHFYSYAVKLYCETAFQFVHK